MSLETRHAEKNSLYYILLILSGGTTLEHAEAQLRATMEPEDVELVEKAVADFLKKTKKEG